jgi:hypothetical protein
LGIRMSVNGYIPASLGASMWISVFYAVIAYWTWFACWYKGRMHKTSVTTLKLYWIHSWCCISVQVTLAYRSSLSHSCSPRMPKDTLQLSTSA